TRSISDVQAEENFKQYEQQLEEKRRERQQTQQYLSEVNRLGNIEVEQTSPTQRIESFIIRRPLVFEMADKILTSRISKQLDRWPTFGGKLTENVTKWLKDITNEMDLVKFDNAQKLSVIQTYLVDDARKWLINNMERLSTWPAFVEAIKQTYSSAFAKEAAITQVAQRNQGLDETVMHYYNDMIELFDVIDHHMNDLLKVSYLKNGLKLSLKKEVSRKNPQTPSEFIRAAVEEEGLDYGIATSVHNWENPVKKEIQSTNDFSSIQHNYQYTSYPQDQSENDNEDYYARITASNNRYQQQHQQQNQYRPQQQNQYQ
ncbi:unnamed protein product, partial [Adineta steineri]